MILIRSTLLAFLLLVSAAAAVPSFDSSSLLGSSGDDMVRGAGIQSDGTVVLAALIGDATPGGVTATVLAGATVSSSGAIVRLSRDGRSVLSVTRVATEVWDLAIDGSDHIVIAARAAGVITLNANASAVLWANANGGSCERIDASANGDVAALHGSFTNYGDAPAAAGTITVYHGDGSLAGTVPGYRKTYDVAIDSVRGRVYFTGFNQLTGPSGNPVQVAYLRSAAYDGTTAWTDYDWTAAQVDEPNNNNMADTRGVRLSMGEDGRLYATFLCAGGNHIFRYLPTALTTAGPIVGGDLYHQFSNTKSEHKTYFGRYDADTGAVLLGQQFVARLGGGTGAGNTVWAQNGDIHADSNGRVYLALTSAFGCPISPELCPAGTYTGGAVLLAMSADFTTRIACMRVSGSSNPGALAIRTAAGAANPRLVFAGQHDAGTTTTDNFFYVLNPIQVTKGSQKDGFVAVASAFGGSGGAVVTPDLNLIRAQMGRRTTDTGFDSRADIDADGVVGAKDLSSATRSH